ncbi:MAG: hypothetical protein WCT00_05730 [Bacilli bacterium]
MGRQDKCPVCGTEVFKPSIYCSLKCANESQDRADKIKEAFKNSDVLEKRKQTFRERYGVESNFHRADVQGVVKDTIRSKYGVENISQIQQIKEKKKRTVENWTPEFLEKRRKNLDSSWSREHYSKELEEELERGLPNITGVNDPIFSSVKSLATVYRLVNNHRPDLIGSSNNISTPHQEVLDFLQSEGIEFRVNDRTVIRPKEIDIFVPSLGIGFEINGTYWHREDFVGRSYHQDKSLMAKEKDVKLIHLYEFDGNQNIEIVKNLVRKNNRRIFARKCKVREIETKDAKSFIEDNHRYGYARSTVKLGLFLDEELIQVMTFSKPRFNKNYQFELIRLCSLKETTVVGGAGKLFAHFLKNYKPVSVISYSSLNNGYNTVYEKIGFRFEGITKPSYVWCNSNERKSRYQTQMRNESDFMKSKGYHKVYDSGNEIFVWESCK